MNQKLSKRFFRLSITVRLKQFWQRNIRNYKICCRIVLCNEGWNRIWRQCLLPLDWKGILTFRYLARLNPIAPGAFSIHLGKNLNTCIAYEHGLQVMEVNGLSACGTAPTIRAPSLPTAPQWAPLCIQRERFIWQAFITPSCPAPPSDILGISNKQSSNLIEIHAAHIDNFPFSVLHKQGWVEDDPASSCMRQGDTYRLRRARITDQRVRMILCSCCLLLLHSVIARTRTCDIIGALTERSDR